MIPPTLRRWAWKPLHQAGQGVLFLFLWVLGIRVVFNPSNTLMVACSWGKQPELVVLVAIVSGCRRSGSNVTCAVESPYPLASRWSWTCRWMSQPLCMDFWSELTFNHVCLTRRKGREEPQMPVVLLAVLLSALEESVDGRWSLLAPISYSLFGYLSSEHLVRQTASLVVTVAACRLHPHGPQM